MNLSVLLPTRNGGAYLGDALQAVLAQPGRDFEVIVADNANEDGTSEVLAAFQDDPRLTVVRSREVLPVAENWNRAMEAAAGDHVLVLGDDDLLLPGFFDWLRTALDSHGYPDCLTYNAYSFVAASSIQGMEGSYFGDPHHRFGEQLGSGEISPSKRRGIVRSMFKFRPGFPLNIQTTVFSRRAAHRLPGPVFKPPFPDHYLLTALLLTVDRWVYVDSQPLVIGVSPKSFGHFVYNSQDGLDYLGIDTSFDGNLPGNELLNGMHVWLQMIRRDFGDLLGSTAVSRGDYVARQLWTWYVQTRSGHIESDVLRDRLRRLTATDVVAAVGAALDPQMLGEVIRRLRGERGAGLLWPDLAVAPGIETITEFAAWIEDGVST